MMTDAVQTGLAMLVILVAIGVILGAVGWPHEIYEPGESIDARVVVGTALGVATWGAGVLIWLLLSGVMIIAGGAG
jgi:hypothetical protein